MKLAVFTSHFPGRLNTFFARDMRAMIEAGIELHIFPLYPLDPGLWRYVPDILGPQVLPRDRVHHLDLRETLPPRGLTRVSHVARFLRDTSAIRASAIGFGLLPAAKCEYTFLKAWTWAQAYADDFDHVLAYWGNYSATCAYVFHRLMSRTVPMSMFLHAGTDLYRDQVFLGQKMLYADNIFVVCEFNRRFIEARFRDIYPRLARKIHLYHLGLDLDAFRVELDHRQASTVLAVGSLEAIKGFDYLIDATARMVARGVAVTLEIVGEGPERVRLMELAERLGLRSRVVFHGLLPFDAVREIMGQATLLAHPSTGLGDAVPTVIKESLALGTPVVASNVAGIPELLDDGRCGALVPPKDADALANAIERLLADAPKRRQIALAGRRHAERRFDLWRNGAALAARLKNTQRHTWEPASPQARRVS